MLLNGVANNQNVRVWATEDPLHFHERDNYEEKICVWLTKSSHCIIEPIFDDTVQTYHVMKSVSIGTARQLLKSLDMDNGSSTDTTLQGQS